MYQPPEDMVITSLKAAVTNHTHARVTALAKHVAPLLAPIITEQEKANLDILFKALFQIYAKKTDNLPPSVLEHRNFQELVRTSQLPDSIMIVLNSKQIRIGLRAAMANVWSLYRLGKEYTGRMQLQPTVDDLEYSQTESKREEDVEADVTHNTMTMRAQTSKTMISTAAWLAQVNQIITALRSEQKSKNSLTKQDATKKLRVLVPAFNTVLQQLETTEVFLRSITAVENFQWQLQYEAQTIHVTQLEEANQALTTRLEALAGVDVTNQQLTQQLSTQEQVVTQTQHELQKVTVLKQQLEQEIEKLRQENIQLSLATQQSRQEKDQLHDQFEILSQAGGDDRRSVRSYAPSEAPSRAYTVAPPRHPSSRPMTLFGNGYNHASNASHKKNKNDATNWTLKEDFEYYRDTVGAHFADVCIHVAVFLSPRFSLTDLAQFNIAIDTSEVECDGASVSQRWQLMQQLNKQVKAESSSPRNSSAFDNLETLITDFYREKVRTTEFVETISTLAKQLSIGCQPNSTSHTQSATTRLLQAMLVHVQNFLASLGIAKENRAGVECEMKETADKHLGFPGFNELCSVIPNLDGNNASARRETLFSVLRQVFPVKNSSLAQLQQHLATLNVLPGKAVKSYRMLDKACNNERRLRLLPAMDSKEHKQYKVLMKHYSDILLQYKNDVIKPAIRQEQMKQAQVQEQHSQTFAMTRR